MYNKFWHVILTALFSAVFVLLNLGPCWAEVQHNPAQELQKNLPQHSENHAYGHDSHEHNHHHSEITFTEKNDCCPDSPTHCCLELASKLPNLIFNSNCAELSETLKASAERLAFLIAPNLNSIQTADITELKPTVLRWPSSEQNFPIEPRPLATVILLI